MLELAEAEDEDDLNDIENAAEKIQSRVGKKRQKPVKIREEDAIELEYEREDIRKEAPEMIKAKTKYQKVAHKSSGGKKIDA